MDSQQQFCLKWNSFGSNLATAFGNLFKSESLTDVILFCEGVTFKAHRLILAACSKHFQDLFERAPLCPSVLVILDGTSSSNMSALLEFMYKGELANALVTLSQTAEDGEIEVKGLSIEHEKLAVVQGQGQTSHSSTVSHDSQLDSPTGRKQAKISGSGAGNGVTKESLEGLTGGSEQHLQLHHPSVASSSYSPVMSPYMHPPLYRPAYEQRIPASAPPPSSHYDTSPRKRHHRSSSEAISAQDSAIRASVLRDGSKSRPPSEAEKHSNMSMAYRPSDSQQHQDIKPQLDEKEGYMGRYDGGPDARDNAAVNVATSAANTVTYDRTAAADTDGNGKAASESRRSSVDPGNSCPEDLRVKLELSARPEEHHTNAVPYAETSVDKPPEIMPTPNTWNSGAAVKISPLKGSSISTADGKKLQCPFCERLYGYETNLRAHIRQRHQGIRVPCPFCSRTFTRNNTVRRHIAREHKTEYGVKTFQQTQVHNHNNQ
uniref:Zinc finger protein chinmo n=2 Tax=Timema TaxID=61471 RepID=A0A7R9DWT7_9NEOP|nr:unnamed protein product [Timema monikensis]